MVTVVTIQILTVVCTAFDKKEKDHIRCTIQDFHIINKNENQFLKGMHRMVTSEKVGTIVTQHFKCNNKNDLISKCKNVANA